MYKIIVALDLLKDSDLVVEKAVEMADKFGAELHLVHAIASVSAHISTTMVVDPLAGIDTSMLENELDIIQSQKNIVQGQLDAIAEKLKPRVVVTKILMGVIEDEVGNYVQETGASLIVVGTHHRTGFVKFLIGETSVKILHEVKIPILVVPTLEKQ